MAMHNPSHPGEFINEVYLAPYGVSLRRLAERLDVARSTLTRLVRRQNAVSPEMALRLSVALGRTPETWLAMQHNYDFWQARKHVDLRKVKRLDVGAA